MAASGGVLSDRTRLPGFASVLAARVRARLRSLAAARHSIGARLLIAVVLFSGAVALILTAIRVYIDYRRDVSAIDYRLTQISDSYLDSLAEGLWTRNEQQLQLKLQQILVRPDIGAVEVREAGTADDRFVVRLSGKSESSAIAREYALRYKGQGQDRVIGTLRVEATLADVYRRLVGNALTILAAQATQTFLVCLFVLYIFRYLVTRHLSAIAADLDSHRIGDSPLQLRLRRSPPRREDELERLITAFNTLSYNLHIAYRDLHEREARIQRLVDANIIGIFIWDFDGRILEANDEFLRVVGYDREDLAAGRICWTDLTPSEWLERDMQRWIPEHKMTGRLPPIEKEYFRKDGSRVPVLVGMTGFDETGNNGVAFVLDISERKRAERALRDSEELKRRIIESSKDCIKVLDLDGNLLFMSSGGQQLLEIDDIQPYLNACWIDFWPPEDRPKISEAIAAARAGGVGQFQAFCPSAKGAPRYDCLCLKQLAPHIRCIPSPCPCRKPTL
jgi:PAS domain S-box-containing protein